MTNKQLEKLIFLYRKGKEDMNLGEYLEELNQLKEFANE